MFEKIYSSILKEQAEVLTVIEVAKILRIGKNKAYSLINKGELSSIKTGNKIIVPKVCLVNFLIDVKNYQFVPDSSPIIAGL